MKKKRIHFGIKLMIAMTVYALIFVFVAWQGFNWFWDFIDAYEKSRPQTTIDAYMETLDVSRVQDHCSELIAGIDHNIQSEDACLEKIADALKGGISFAKKLNECNDTTTVYMLLSGGKTIGKVTMTAQPADKFGFTPWVVTGESFDLSFLVGKGDSITVPHDYAVYANGTLLGSDYITETDIQYALLKDFYDSYPLPHMVTYQVDAILGDLTLTVSNPAGETVTAEAWADEAVLLNSCTPEQIGEIDGFIDEFLTKYVEYTSNKNKARYDNYQKLSQYLLEGSSLQERMQNALDGLKWVPDRKAHVYSVEIHQRIPFLDGRILCDLTYIVDSYTNNNQPVREELTIQLILSPTENGLKAETMFSN